MGVVITCLLKERWPGSSLHLVHFDGAGYCKKIARIQAQSEIKPSRDIWIPAPEELRRVMSSICANLVTSASTCCTFTVARLKVDVSK